MLIFFSRKPKLQTNNACFLLENQNHEPLFLGQMGLLGKSKTPVQNAPLYPNCNKILPPTPVVQSVGPPDDGVHIKVRIYCNSNFYM